MAFAETQHLVVQLDLKGNLNAKLGAAARSIQGFDKATSNTQRSLSKFGRNIERGVVVGIAATGAALLGVVKAAADYESAFAGVRKTVTATEPQLAELSKQFRDLSKTIPISASELARLGEAGGALGVPTAQLKEFVRVTALLGVTTNLTADEAANSLGILGNVLHLTGEEYSKFASSLVALGNAGASTERDIVSIAERAGAAGELIGVSTENILGFSSAVASLGIESEAGGTALQKFFIDSAKAVAGGGKDLKEFAKVAGVSTKDFAKSFKQDAGAALQDFLEGLGKLPQAKQLKVLEDLGFNDARITRTLLGLANNTKLVGDQMNVANKAFAENTALTKEAEQRFATFDSQMAILKNTLTDVAITVGSKLLPKITPLIKRLADFINLPKTQGQIGDFATKLADGFEKMAAEIQKIDFGPIIDGLKLSAQIAGKVIDIFKALPGPLQAALVGGFALNKVTGGLGTSIAKDVGGALLNQFASRGSSPANPLFVSQVGGIPGAPGGGGGVGGLLKGAAAVALGAIAFDLYATKLAPLNEANAGQTTGIADSVAKNLSSATVDELKLQRDAVIKGFNDLQAATSALGPLQGVLYGSQIDVLKGQIDVLTGELGRRAKAGGPIGGSEREEALLGATADQTRAAEMNARRIEAAENRTAMAVHLVTKGTALIRGSVIDLRKASGAQKVGQAVKTALHNIFEKGAGGSGGAANVLRELRTQLKNTHDPGLQRVLRSAINRVEHKMVQRRIVEAQLKKADEIARSTKTNAQKIVELKRVQQAIGNKNAGATRRVQEKIDAAKRAQVSAQRATTKAVKDKDLSVAIANTINVAAQISSRAITTVTARQNRYYNVPS